MNIKKIEKELIKKATKNGINKFVVGAIIQNKQSILLLIRNNDDFMGGLEELPSGKVEKNENLEEALKREIQEETNLTITKTIKYIGSFDYKSSNGLATRQFNFLVETNNNNVKIDPSEHKSFRWIDISNIKSSNITNEIKEIIKKI